MQRPESISWRIASLHAALAQDASPNCSIMAFVRSIALRFFFPWVETTRLYIASAICSTAISLMLPSLGLRPQVRRPVEGLASVAEVVGVVLRERNARDFEEARADGVAVAAVHALCVLHRDGRLAVDGGGADGPRRTRRDQGRHFADLGQVVVVDAGRPRGDAAGGEVGGGG